MTTWQLQEAKAKLSEVVQSAVNDGPQCITLRGEPVAVLISQAEYIRLKRPKPDFVTFMRASPLLGLGLDLERDQTANRDVDL